MLRNEAGWLSRHLGDAPAEQLSPLLSIGSGSAASRARQPWIDQLVFAPLARRGVEVLHHEHEPAPGVDVAGDLRDPAFVETLRDLGARSVLCANVLEHVEDPRALTAAMGDLVASGGYVVVSVPRRYPYHPDPIDTMLRPSVEELAAMFPALRLVAGEEVACGTLLSYVWSVRGKRAMIANGLKAALRRRNTHGPRRAGGGVAGHFLQRTAVTCAVFARPG